MQRVVLILFLLFLSPAISYALEPSPEPSFYCGSELTVIEASVCYDPNLSLMDSAMARLYSDAIKTDVGVKREQRNWIKKVRSECSTISCLKSVYTNRIVSLSDKSGIENPDIDGEFLFNRFNLRTLNSYFGPSLKTVCHSYLSDFYSDKGDVKFHEKGVVIDGKEEWVKLSILEPGKVILTVDSKLREATYYNSEKHPYYFDGEANEVRSSEAYIENSEECL